MVVPLGKAARVNSLTDNMLLSTCRCPSRNPGTSVYPAASIICVSSPMVWSTLPTVTIRPCLIATSLCSSISLVLTFTMLAPRITTSAFKMPMAVWASSAVISLKLFSVRLYDMFMTITFLALSRDVTRQHHFNIVTPQPLFPGHARRCQK